MPFRYERRGEAEPLTPRFMHFLREALNAPIRQRSQSFVTDYAVLYAVQMKKPPINAANSLNT